jgi:hypothetical protein
MNSNHLPILVFILMEMKDKQVLLLLIFKWWIHLQFYHTSQRRGCLDTNFNG